MLSGERREMEVKDHVYGRRYLAFALLAGCFVFALAYTNRTTFPFPWNDEARFYLPAFWWAEHFSLSPTNLHAPNGIFWVPDGFTIFLGLALCLFGKTMQVARTTCECVVSLGVTLFALGFGKLAGSWKIGVLSTLLLLTPPVVLAANMVRMEAPLFLLIALVLLLHVHGYFLAAGSLLAGSLLLHPALGIAAAGYILITCVTPIKEVGHRDAEAVMDWIIFAVVVIGISAELLRIVHHLDMFRAHMTYQMHRKVGLPLHSKLIKPQGVILLISCSALATLLWRRHVQPELGTVWDVLPMAAVTLCLLIYAVVAGGMTYDVYSLSVGPALVVCLVCRDFFESSGRPPHLISGEQSP
jgi:hypothetical protein